MKKELMTPAEIERAKRNARIMERFAVMRDTYKTATTNRIYNTLGEEFSMSPQSIRLIVLNAGA